MFTFLATIFSVKFLMENWKIVLAVVCAIIFIIFLIVRNRKKKRAAYLALPVLFIGNKTTCTYHRCNCSKLQGANPLNLISFRHPDEIRRLGYKPCQICKP